MAIKFVTWLAGLTNKATPDDADELYVRQESDNTSRSTTWANIKTALGSIFAKTGAIGSSGLTVGTGKLVGRGTAGTGPLEEITLGTNLSLAGNTLNAAGGGGGGTPGGSTTQVQYNNAGAFAGHADFTYDGAGTVTAKKFTAQKTNAVPGFTFGSGATDPAILYENTGVIVFATANGGAMTPVRTGLLTASGAVHCTNEIRFITSSISIYSATDFAGCYAAGTANLRDWKVRNLIGAGNLATGAVAKSADYTATTSDGTIEVDASGAARTITLFAASGNAGKIIVVKKADSSANAVTIDGNATETIDGAATVVLSTQWASATLQVNATGTAWIKI